MESRRWLLAAFAGLAMLLLGCVKTSGLGSQTSALPVLTLTPTRAALVTGTPAAGTPLAGAAAREAPGRPGAGFPLVPSTPFAPSGPTVPAGIVLLQQSGVGTSATPTVELKTQTFVAPGSWDLQWKYDCSGLGRAGNLSVDAFRGDGGYVNDPASVSEVGTGGQGVSAYSLPGPIYLVVNSVCSWTVTVVTSARPTATPIGSSSVPASAASAGGGGGGAPSIGGVSTPVAVSTIFGAATATPAAGAGGAASAATATPTAAAATATPSAAAGANGGTESLIGGRPILAPSISTPIPPIEQAQGVFAVPAGVSLGARPAAPATVAAVAQATRAAVSVTIAPAASP